MRGATSVPNFVGSRLAGQLVDDEDTQKVSLTNILGSCALSTYLVPMIISSNPSALSRSLLPAMGRPSMIV